jgi:hypothetical protein
MFEWLFKTKSTSDKYNEAVAELEAYNKVIKDNKLGTFSENLLSKLVALEVKISMYKKEMSNTSVSSDNIVHFNKDKK